MKNIGKKILSLFLLILIFVSCKTTKENVNETKSLAKEENSSSNEFTDISSPQIPSVMIDGTIYQKTGLVNSGVTCGTADGTIEFSVANDKMPEKNGQGNFGKGYEYQYWTEDYISVKIDDRWILFKNKDAKLDQMPEGVANFKAKLDQVSQDELKLSLEEIPQEYKYIFQSMDVENIKPVSINRKDAIFDKKIMDQGIENFQGQSLIVYFDGQIKNLEAEESSPIEVGEIYKISPAN
jgi:hypothetical protein